VRLSRTSVSVRPKRRARSAAIHWSKLALSGTSTSNWISSRPSSSPTGFISPISSHSARFGSRDPASVKARLLLRPHRRLHPLGEDRQHWRFGRNPRARRIVPRRSRYGRAWRADHTGGASRALRERYRYRYARRALLADEQSASETGAIS